MYFLFLYITIIVIDVLFQVVTPDLGVTTFLTTVYPKPLRGFTLLTITHITSITPTGRSSNKDDAPFLLVPLVNHVGAQGTGIKRAISPLG